MLNPLITICIPTYNGEQYLKICIDSCIEQTFTDYEIIICDDGSSDKTIEIIESYNNSKIKLFKNTVNLGLVGNWNKCIELSKGQWIKFVFQDDYISANCLQEFVNEIDERTNLIVSKRDFIIPNNSTKEFINYYTNEVRTLENTSNFKGKIYSPQLISKLAVQNICMNFIGEPSLIFFRKKCVEELGYFNSDLKQICDLEFVLKLACKYGLKYIPKKICSFRVHLNSTTSSNLNNKFFEMHYIEPLLFSYYLLYHTNFKIFRTYLNFFQLIKLKLYFKVKAYRAYKANIYEGHNYYLFNDSNSKFKEITANKTGNFFVKLVATLI